ncbi:MAG: hypothetical protein HOV81_43200 [Kofleriaceae bacterium]|nr:hypothetical protein [Kofleriaceae bacterium]
MKALLAVFLALAACGEKKPPVEPPTPAPSQATPPASSAMTPDECTAMGGRVKGDIGDGKVACDPGEKELGRVTQGIEGAVCCAGAAH